MSRDFDSRYPGLITYGWRLFAFTGQLQRFEHEIARPDASTNPEWQLAARFNLLLYARRFDELTKLIESTELRTMAQSVAGMVTVPAVGQKPVAECMAGPCCSETTPAGASRREHIAGVRCEKQVNR